MQVNVRVSGVLAQQIGAARFAVPLPAGATVQELRRHLGSKYPALSAELERAVVVFGGAHQPEDATLEPGAEVALLMPIAGG